MEKKDSGVKLKKNKIIIKLLAEIPQAEVWLFLPENKEILERVEKSLKQKAKINLGSFKKYTKDK